MMNTKTDIQKIFRHTTGKRKSGMKKLLFLIVLLTLLSGCSLFTVRGSGNIISETRDVHNFSRVVFGGTGELMLTQGEEEALTITTDDNLMAYIESEVHGDTLYIRHKETISPGQPIRIELRVKTLLGLEISGLIHADTGDISTEQLEIEISGVSDLIMSALMADRLMVSQSGTTGFEMTGEGQVNEQTIVLSGTNTYDTPNLRSQETDISLSGSGDATVWTTEVLKVEMSGNGSVNYYGSPQISQNGSGNVRLTSLGNP